MFLKQSSYRETIDNIILPNMTLACATDVLVDLAERVPVPLRPPVDNFTKYN